MDSVIGASEWTTEEMEAERPPCFHFFLDECTNGASCNYNHNPIFKANLMGIPQTASKESISEELRSFRPVHIAYTGNPSQCNFGRGCGIVGFSSIQDLASAVKGTQNLSAAEAVRVAITNHQCRGCGVPMRFSAGGVAYFRSGSTTGTRKEPRAIARPAAGDFDCGECAGAGAGGGRIASASQPRALKPGEAVW